jgi:pimeloyl-ACP methyl ester carboxylesterase
MNREAAGPRASWVDLGGLRLHVRESGPADAEPLLLVHGWPQHSGCWQRVADQLGDRYRCVMPDLRGFGLSDAPPGGYDKRQLGDDLVVLLDALELPRVGYVGHDWGGFIGFELALRARSGSPVYWRFPSRTRGHRGMTASTPCAWRHSHTSFR